MKHSASILSALALLVATSLLAHAQDRTEIKLIPVVTGYTSFDSTFEPGKQTLSPHLNPIFLVPLGRRALIESEFELESDIERAGGVWGPTVVEKKVEYLQLDYFANRYVTVVVGRFLTPFGIFNERLHPPWIKNLQTVPLIRPMVEEVESSTGAMLRGGIRLNSSVNLNYAGYFSTLSTQKYLTAERSAGGRWSLFFPKSRFEVGFSLSRRLSGEDRFNLWGLDATWNVPRSPLDVRAEYMRGFDGSGYWIEGAYRLSRVPKWRTFFRRSQAVVRVEQFFAPAHEQMVEGLPAVGTQRVMVGWNYKILDGFNLTFAFGRNFSSEGDHNFWNVGFAYRFLH